jgi:hypothetical protein
MYKTVPPFLYVSSLYVALRKKNRLCKIYALISICVMSFRERKIIYVRNITERKNNKNKTKDIKGQLKLNKRDVGEVRMKE